MNRRDRTVSYDSTETVNNTRVNKVKTNVIIYLLKYYR